MLNLKEIQMFMSTQMFQQTLIHRWNTLKTPQELSYGTNVF